MFGGVLGACAQIAGLTSYSPGGTAAEGDADPGAGEAGATPQDASLSRDVTSGTRADGSSRDASGGTGDATTNTDAPTGSDDAWNADASEPADAASLDAVGDEEDAAACPATAPTLCNGTCVDEQNDVDNCGGCGQAFACAAGQSCSAGQCLGCGTTCPLSTVTATTCAAGGCNTQGGACSQAGQGCYCTQDSACKSGNCVKTTGQNDVSCTNCTGTGASDGFSCALVAPGIPEACTAPSFGYTPSNFTPGSYTPPATGTTINCSTTYSSTSHAFTGWCSGQTAPTVYSNVAQAGGGHAVDILAFASLTVATGNTLTLTGANPIILAVYGPATIAGVIDASAQGSTPGAGATTCAAGASGGGASGPAYTAGTDAGASGGGGGGLAVAGGGGDFSTYNGFDGGPVTGTDTIGASGGSAHGTDTAVPLAGGCSGGAGASGTAGNAGGTGGGGGGGLQISASGTISGSGTIKSNGGAGGAGATVSPASAHNDGAGGGGGGSGGDILIESASSNSLTRQSNGGMGGAGSIGYGADTTSVNTWPGAPGGNGGTNSGGSTAAPANGGPMGARGQSYAGGGGGGGGGYGWIRVNTGAAPAYGCVTALSPTPACNAGHTACLCVADSDCSSGKCANSSGQCTGTCSGSGATDGADCQTLVSAATVWACSVGNCDTVTTAAGACAAAGVACWCTADTQCTSGHCAEWVGCAAGACSGSGTADGMNCVP